MDSKITRETVEGYLKCKTKAHLQLTGERGTASDYGVLLAERRTEIRRRAIGQVLSHSQEAVILRGVAVTPAVLSQGAPFLQDATLMNDTFSPVPAEFSKTLSAPRDAAPDVAAAGVVVLGFAASAAVPVQAPFTLHGEKVRRPAVCGRFQLGTAGVVRYLLRISASLKLQTVRPRVVRLVG